MNLQLNKNYDFWRINFGHVLTMVAMIGGLIMFFSRFEARISVLEAEIQWIKASQMKMEHIRVSRACIDSIPLGFVKESNENFSGDGQARVIDRPL